jgi:hypothetical protein
VADTPDESDSAVFGTGFGGVTDIKAGPDGYLYVVSFIDGTIFRIVPATEPAAATVDLTVRSADLSGETITGMFTVIRGSDGTVLREGYTPLTFAGEEGSSYTVTMADFRNREFVRWEDGSTNRERTVTLDKDTTITAHYKVESAADSDTVTVHRLAQILDGDNCFDEKDERRLGNAVDKLIGDIFGEDEVKTDKLERILDRIIEECAEDDDRGKDNQGNGGSGDDEEEDD